MIDVAPGLRTPLTNIRGYLEAIIDGVLEPSAAVFSLLQAETMRLVQLLEDVLQLARADAARGDLNLEPTELRARDRDDPRNLFTRLRAEVGRGQTAFPG